MGTDRASEDGNAEVSATVAGGRSALEKLLQDEAKHSEATMSDPMPADAVGEKRNQRAARGLALGGSDGQAPPVSG